MPSDPSQSRGSTKGRFAMQRVVSTVAVVGAFAALPRHCRLGRRRAPEGGPRRGGHAGDRLGAVLGVRSSGGRRPVRLP